MFSSAPIFAFLDVGGPEMLVVFVLILVLFGGKRMPELARGLGKSMRDFKRARDGVEDQIKRALEEDPVPAKPKRLRKPKPAPEAATTTPSDTTVYDEAAKAAGAAGITATADGDSGAETAPDADAETDAVAEASEESTDSVPEPSANDDVIDDNYFDPHEDEYIGGTAESNARAHGIEEEDVSSDDAAESGPSSESDTGGSNDANDANDAGDAQKKKSDPDGEASDGGGI